MLLVFKKNKIKLNLLMATKASLQWSHHCHQYQLMGRAVGICVNGHELDRFIQEGIAQCASPEV